MQSTKRKLILLAVLIVSHAAARWSGTVGGQTIVPAAQANTPDQTLPRARLRPPSPTGPRMILMSGANSGRSNPSKINRRPL